MTAATDRPSGAEALVRLLEGYGAEVIVGRRGDTGPPFHDALARHDHGIRHVRALDERSIGLVAFTTDIATASRGRYALTELDQEALLRPVTRWNRTVAGAGELPRAAFAPAGPSHGDAVRRPLAAAATPVTEWVAGGRAAAARLDAVGARRVI
jgi:hypothetical protein